MNIAIDITPLTKGHFLAHRVRGTGFYIENLRGVLQKHFPENRYLFFSQGEKLPDNVDLVHYPYFEPFFVTLPLTEHYPTVVTVHDLTPFVFPDHFPSGIRGKLKWQIQKRLLKKANAIVTDSNASKDDIIKFTAIPSEKIHVVYLASSNSFKKISTEAQNHIRRKYTLPKKFVLYVGDATWNKNLPRLIEAIKKVDVPFVMVGKALASKDFDMNNPWNQDLALTQKLAEADKRIIRLGFVPTDDLVGIYNLAAVFAMPSLYEGFGLPVLEAMACGTPVVTTNAGSLPEVAGDAAFYVDPYDVDSIANGIEEVFFTEKLYREFAKKGLLQAKKFSWQKTAQETMKVYRSI